MAHTQAEPREVVIGLAAAAGLVTFVLFFVNIDAAFLLALILALIVAGLILLLLWQRTPEPMPAKPPFTKPARTTPQAVAAQPVAELRAADDAAETQETAAEDDAGPSAPAPADTLGEDYDKDGIHEGTGEGVKPRMLDAAREGGPDNLKEIKGVGPKLEEVLHGLGVYHFDQIAAWSADEVAWVDANLKGFRGRVSRDGWTDQAKVLAAGGKTEFAQRVDKGQVY